MNFKFLNQHPLFHRIDREWIEFFIADFYCAKLRLVIELDGPIHENNKDYDSERDLKLSTKGILVVRIFNEELQDVNSVISKLKMILMNREIDITK